MRPSTFPVEQASIFDPPPAPVPAPQPARPEPMPTSPVTVPELPREPSYAGLEMFVSGGW